MRTVLSSAIVTAALIALATGWQVQHRLQSWLDLPPTTLPPAVAPRCLHRPASVSSQVSIADVPGCMIKAVLAIEDHRFYQHHGLDPLAMLRAAHDSLMAGHLVEGASTITQQLAKNRFLDWRDRTANRKLKEGLLACQLERRYSKDRILEAYFNEIYFGRGAYGIEAASQRYFGAHVSDLSLSQAAFLAAIIKAPSKLGAPGQEQLAEKRQRQVLRKMAEYGYIDDIQERRAESARLVFAAPAKATSAISSSPPGASDARTCGATVAAAAAPDGEIGKE